MRIDLRKQPEDLELQLPYQKATSEKEWRTSIDVVAEVNEELVAEALTIMSGVSSAGIAAGHQSGRQEPPYPPAAVTDDDREIWAMA